MKTALILTGHMRCFEQVFPNTLEHIIQPYNPDIFITTWDTEGWWTSPEKDPQGKGINANSPLLDVTRVTELYRPVQLNVLKQSFFDEAIDICVEEYELKKKVKEIRPRNIVSQFMLWNHAWHSFERLDLALEPYDFVIRMRPDIVFPHGLPELDPKAINLIQHTNHEGNGYGDMFIATNQWEMGNFMLNLYNWSKYVEDRFCPHLIMQQIADGLSKFKNGPEVKVLPIPKYLMHTPNGQYKDAN